MSNLILSESKVKGLSRYQAGQMIRELSTQHGL